MSRKQKRQDSRMVTPPPITAPKPRVTSFVPDPCSACQRLRDEDSNAQGRSYSRVYSTSGRTRYCKCSYCGNTWKQIANTTA
jgi:hypothetical protein